MKQLRFLLLTVACCIGLASCNNSIIPQNRLPLGMQTTAEPQQTHQPENKEPEKIVMERNYKISEITDSLKLHGRTLMESNGLACDASASGISFAAYVEGDVKLTVTATAETYFTVTVDGVRSTQRLKADAGTSVLTVASFATGGEHEICVLKQTEARLSLCVLSNLQWKGYLNNAPAQKSFYIEFIGDSITGGYGVLCANGTANGGSAQYQDATQAFAYLTAQALNADHSLVNCSGMGLSKSLVSIPFVATDLYSKQSKYRSESIAYTPTRTPDLVVINLGTNDSASGASSSQFIKDAGALIDLVRATYGKDVPIVWVYNMMNDSMYGSARFAISAKGGESAGIFTCEMTQNADGGVGHPSLTAQQAAAERLASLIRSKNLIPS